MTKRVIIVTDGDSVARRAIELAAGNVGGRTISATAGNPTPLTGDEVCALIKSSDGDPIVVMVDDRGHSRKGKGEAVIQSIAADNEIEILGVIAVASNTQVSEGTEVDCSIDYRGCMIPYPVNKHGMPMKKRGELRGDTVSVLNEIEVPTVIGVGDPGKMGEADSLANGAPVLTQAMRQIMALSRN